MFSFRKLRFFDILRNAQNLSTRAGKEKSSKTLAWKEKSNETLSIRAEKERSNKALGTKDKSQVRRYAHNKTLGNFFTTFTTCEGNTLSWGATLWVGPLHCCSPHQEEEGVCYLPEARIFREKGCFKEACGKVVINFGYPALIFLPTGM